MRSKSVKFPLFFLLNFTGRWQPCLNCTGQIQNTWDDNRSSRTPSKFISSKKTGRKRLSFRVPTIRIVKFDLSNFRHFACTFLTFTSCIISYILAVGLAVTTVAFCYHNRPKQGVPDSFFSVYAWIVKFHKI